MTAADLNRSSPSNSRARLRELLFLNIKFSAVRRERSSIQGRESSLSLTRVRRVIPEADRVSLRSENRNHTIRGRRAEMKQGNIHLWFSSASFDLYSRFYLRDG